MSESWYSAKSEISFSRETDGCQMIVGAGITRTSKTALWRRSFPRRFAWAFTFMAKFIASMEFKDHTATYWADKAGIIQSDAELTPKAKSGH
jgi:hypothetical protein